jgi:hypothetical protein
LHFASLHRLQPVEYLRAEVQWHFSAEQRD